MACSITRRVLCRRVSNIYEHFTVASYSGNNSLWWRTIPIKSTYWENQKVKPAYSSSPIYFKQFSTSSRLFKNEEERKDNDTKLTLFQKFKKMYRDYWYVLVPVHLVTSAAWFGSFYYMAKR